ncbi:MAG: hypothetical protein FJ138_07950 [Deltaproteobacteria bacterium]|nr:hypothetical protein [Deltaproteobacteria bacterium]
MTLYRPLTLDLQLRGARRALAALAALLLSAVAGPLAGCVDNVAVVDEGPQAGAASIPGTLAPGECPPELINQVNGECAITDIDAYNRKVRENEEQGRGAAVTPEDALNVDNTILQEQDSNFLSQEGAGKFYVYVNERKRIGVRVLNNTGAFVPGIGVRFEILTEEASDPRGATLDAMSAVSDEFGVAAVNVQAGALPTFFKLRMVSDETNEMGVARTTEIVYRISVIQPNIADSTDIEVLPPGQRCNLISVGGTYDIQNSYQPARLLGDGVFNALRTINQALTNPGGLIGDWIRDRIGGIAGDVLGGVVRDIVNSLLRGLNLPAWANQIVNIVQDVTGLLTNLRINGNIRLGNAAGPNCEVAGVHTWEQLIFSWQGGSCPGLGGNNGCGEERLNLSEMGVSVSETEFSAYISNQTPLSVQLNINEHQLQLNIGVIALAVLQNIILPQRSNARSFGDLIAQIMPCDDFGYFASGFVSIPFVDVGRIAADACRSGVRALGNDLTQRILGNLGVDTFKMQGSVKMRSNDMDIDAELMYEGVWSDGGNGTYLEGTFQGTRRP